MKKPQVNQQTCIGCGTCPALCPKTFVINDDGKAQVSNPSGDSQEAIQGAIDACPVKAISWDDE